MALRIYLRRFLPETNFVSVARRRSSKAIPRSGIRGFTVLELVIVVVITLILAGTASFQIAAAIRQAHINAAVQIVERELRNAHEKSVDTRTEYVVTFQTPGKILTQTIAAGVLTPPTSIDLPNDEQFLIVPGVRSAPENPPFGSAKRAIDFDLGNGGGSNVLFFYPDGTVLDAAGNLNNGVAYIAHPADLYSSKAVTIWGATGRVKIWTLAGKGGATQWR